MLNWYVYGEHAPFYYGKAKAFTPLKIIDLEIRKARLGGDQQAVRPNRRLRYVDVPTMMRAAVKGAPSLPPRAAADEPNVGEWAFVEKEHQEPEDIKGQDSRDHAGVR